ncbi:hypothetical protein DRQ36_06065 [bacterium]|nr:MAG: hypothetical protein DRQ36_06065 [bacterium]
MLIFAENRKLTCHCEAQRAEGREQRAEGTPHPALRAPPVKYMLVFQQSLIYYSGTHGFPTAQGHYPRASPQFYSLSRNTQTFYSRKNHNKFDSFC